jgi:hypothetical protein
MLTPLPFLMFQIGANHWLLSAPTVDIFDKLRIFMIALREALPPSFHLSFPKLWNSSEKRLFEKSERELLERSKLLG